MTKTADKLRSQLSELSFEDREAILDHLLDLQGWEQVTEADEEWVAELDRRMEEVESGKVAGIPVEEVFPELQDQPGGGRKVRAASPVPTNSTSRVRTGDRQVRKQERRPRRRVSR